MPVVENHAVQPDGGENGKQHRTPAALEERGGDGLDEVQGLAHVIAWAAGQPVGQACLPDPEEDRGVGEELFVFAVVARVFVLDLVWLDAVDYVQYLSCKIARAVDEQGYIEPEFRECVKQDAPADGCVIGVCFSAEGIHQPGCAGLQFVLYDARARPVQRDPEFSKLERKTQVARGLRDLLRQDIACLGDDPGNGIIIADRVLAEGQAPHHTAPGRADDARFRRHSGHADTGKGRIGRNRHLSRSLVW